MDRGQKGNILPFPHASGKAGRAQLRSALELDLPFGSRQISDPERRPMMENALRTFIALPGQIYIFNVRVYILFLKRKTKTTKVNNISGNRTNKQRNKTKKPNAFPHFLFSPLLVLTGRCLDRGEGAQGGRIVSTPPAPAKESHLCTYWWRIQHFQARTQIIF